MKDRLYTYDTGPIEATDDIEWNTPRKDKIYGLIIAPLAMLIGCALFHWGYTRGKRRGTIETDAHWQSLVVSRHYAYIVKQDGKPSRLEWRYITKFRRVPVIVLDKDGNEVNGGN